MTILRPADLGEVAQHVAWAANEREALEIVAGGSKRRLGRPVQAPHVLDVSALAGIVDYDPAELVLTARAATPMAAIQAALDARRQMLAFEPPDWRALLGETGHPTLGGVIACNLAGPRRVRAGAARDHVLGFHAVSGRGEAWKAGGRVVKNVTGYDMSKLQAGAFGTLGVLTELSVRVMPRPETQCTFVLRGLSDARGVAMLADALNTPHEVSAAAHLPAAAARRSRLGADEALTLLRLEGPAPSVAYRAALLGGMAHQNEQIDAAASDALWAEIGAVDRLLPPSGYCLWKVCPTPSAAPALLDRVRVAAPSAEGYYDWGGGLLWIALDEAEPDAGAPAVRRALAEAGGGHATLIVAPETLRARVPVFQPEEGPLAALSARVKASFDPLRILNPGRLHESL